jgi:putative hydrolase of HD superfamily
MEGKDLNSIANFLFEVGMLAKTPRSGFFFLGSGEQSVAEHLNRASYIGFTLAQMNGTVDTGKEDEAVADLVKTLPFGNTIKEIIHEYEERKTLESKMAKDSDNLELILSLKEQLDIGNERAQSWIDRALERLVTDEAKQLASVIVKTESDSWWFGNKEDTWWVNRNKK